MMNHKRGIWLWEIMRINQVETFVSPNLIWLTMINVNKNSCQTTAVISRATDNYFPIKINSIFYNWDKYIWQFKQMHFKIWKNTFCIWAYTFCKRSCQTMAMISRASDNYFPIKITMIQLELILLANLFTKIL